ncbi:MAG: tRNA epoxyqueuosine(34) reductase QueG, partial [Porticoccaceae bacterium]|nr:tRNA epoxyqueuosine(34) reductase QueG [Porticoccaceae bacterium]
MNNWAVDEGFAKVGVTDLELGEASDNLRDWLANNYQGEMNWIGDRLELRENPQSLLPGAARAICFRMNYFQDHTQPLKILEDGDKAYISRYALGRDYHKLIRRKLAKIARKIQDWSEQELQQRPFVDSAPVLEKPLGHKAGLGWVGKNTLLLTREGGSWFFLGEILTSLELPVDENRESDECGKCKACMTCCPTDAFPEPYVLDARKCISYLTIEYDGSIPLELRKPMGNRVFGCDDCQLVCPWNRDAAISREDHFSPRHQLEDSELIEIFKWSKAEFEEKTAGSPIRRAGYEQWQRNLAIGLGNGSPTSEAINTLKNYQG